MYQPDPNIVRQLKQCDPALDARWNRFDGHWWVTCRGKDTIKVRNADGSYRPLDGRIVARMREEAWTYRNRFGRLHMEDAKMHEGNQRIEKKQQDDRRDDFRQYVKEEIHPRVVGVGGVDGRRVFGGWSASA